MNPRLTRLAIHTRFFAETCEFYSRLLAQALAPDAAGSEQARFAVPGGLELVIHKCDAPTRVELGFAQLPVATIQALERNPGLADPLGNAILPSAD